jgi:hypothetical protein
MVTLHTVLFYGSLGIFAVLGSIVGIAALVGFWFFLRDDAWPEVTRIHRLTRAWRSERRAWREHRKSKLAKALRDQVVTRRQR